MYKVKVSKLTIKLQNATELGRATPEGPRSTWRYGIYENGTLVLGGFFTRAAAVDAAEHLVWIYAEDLVGALVGPFTSNEAAEAHMEFCRERGDAAEMKIVTDTSAYPADTMRMTPQEDKDFVCP